MQSSIARAVYNYDMPRNVPEGWCWLSVRSAEHRHRGCPKTPVLARSQLSDSTRRESGVSDAHKGLFLRIRPVSRRMADGVIPNPLRDALQQHKWLARCFMFLLAFNSSAGPDGSAERTTQTSFRTVGLDGPCFHL